MVIFIYYSYTSIFCLAHAFIDYFSKPKSYKSSMDLAMIYSDLILIIVLHMILIIHMDIHRIEEFYSNI